MTDKAENLRRLLDAATPGPWAIGQSHHPATVTIYDEDEGWYFTVADCADRRMDGGSEDAALIVALRNDLPAILDELDTLKAQVVELREAVSKAEKTFLLYSNLHAAKRNTSGDAKAKTNRDIAREMSQALANTGGQ